MDELIKQIFSKEKDVRKKALIELSDMSFDHISDKQLFDIYNQLDLILESDEKDVAYFARKLLPKIKQVGKIRKLNLDEDPIHEVYTKKADELISLLASDQKMVRINSVYALAKTGCSPEHVSALERFAEGATEDEAKLAIDSIEAIKVFMSEREEKEAQRKKQREIARKSLKDKKEYKARPVSKTKNYSQLNDATDNNSLKWKKAFFTLFILTFLTTGVLFTPGIFFSESDHLPEDATLLHKDHFLNKVVVVFKLDKEITIKRFSLGMKGWTEIED